MNMQIRLVRLMLIAVVVTILIADRASADETGGGQDLVQLQRNIHDMRLIVDGERAQRKAARRANATPLVIDSRDAPGIGRMREQLAQSLERLESRCFGNEIDADGGNVILICGNNNGTAEGSNVTSAAHTTVLVAPPPSADPESGESDQDAAPQVEVQP